MRNIKIISTGKYLPQKIVTDKEIEQRIGVSPGWVAKKTGVITRHFAEGETSSSMGAKAAHLALEKAGLRFEDIDCIVSGSGTMQQAIPCNAALIQREMGKGDSGTPAFDVNTTCLSFVAALDTVSYMMQGKKYKTVLIVSTEITSIGINWEDKESASLFGDGAVAVIVKFDEEQSSNILSSKMVTYGNGASLSEIKGGGSHIHPRTYSEETKENFLFYMDGKAIFKMSARILPSFVDSLLDEANVKMKDIKLVIPHQASSMAMRIIQKKLGLSDDQFFTYIHNHGNMVAASIPIGIHEAIEQGKIQRGDKIMLLGTSAGLSIGGMILEY